jgi:hypothetical protein
MQSEAANFQGGVVVASDDPRVQKVTLECEGVEQVSFIEKMESYYCVADDVIAIIRAINQWLERLGHEDEIPNDLLYWVMHCEGGDTGQRVLDMLLLIRSYQELIDRFQPKEIILVQSANTTWEDELLLTFAGNIGIKIRVSGRLRLSDWCRKRFWLKWRPLAAGVYWSAKVIQVKLANLLYSQPTIDANKSVMVQLVGSEKKHLNHAQSLLKAINDSGLQGIALGWRLGLSATHLRQEGIAVVDMETWISLCDLAGGWIRTLKSWRRAKSNFHNFLPEGQGFKGTSLLRGILIKSMRSFYSSELLGRYFLSAATKKFFQHHQPKALRPHSLLLPDGVIPYRAIKRIDKSIMIFIQGGWMYDLPEPISDAEIPIPRDEVVYCSCGKLHRDILLNKGYLEKNLFITGMNWLEPITKFGKKYSKIDSRKFLGLNLTAELYILFDPNSFLRGFLTRQEQYLVLLSILELAKCNPRLQISVKPHPSHQKGLLEEIIIQYSLPNVQLIDQSLLPYHALNAADVLVLKWSTLAVEGMLLGVPALGIILDGEDNFKCYDPAVEYHNSLSSLDSKLRALLDDSEYRQNWMKEMEVRQSEYFERHGLVDKGNPAQSVAKIIVDRITGSA